MEKYHQEVVKALQELETIHSKIISATQGKKDESLFLVPKTGSSNQSGSSCNKRRSNIRRSTLVEPQSDSVSISDNHNFVKKRYTNLMVRRSVELDLYKADE
ncbi:hypothetical protein YC2023_025404 [Brassica napus]